MCRSVGELVEDETRDAVVESFNRIGYSACCPRMSNIQARIHVLKIGEVRLVD